MSRSGPRQGLSHAEKDTSSQALTKHCREGRCTEVRTKIRKEGRCPANLPKRILAPQAHLASDLAMSLGASWLAGVKLTPCQALFSFGTGSCYVALADLELIIKTKLLPSK